MKKNRAIIVSLFIICIFASFFAGKSLSEKKYIKNREQQCKTQIVFAIDKIEDLKEEYNNDDMEAIISNIYAAYEYCDNGTLSSSLHDLWNALIFDGENIKGKEDDLVKALKDSNAQDIKDISMDMRTKK